MRKKGLIISFEGIDGCGKTTQARLFCRHLREKGVNAVLLNEPGGTYTGDKIRNILLDKENSICPLSELLLYLASRMQLVEEVIKPAVEEGKTVVLDRYVDSTTAYQGYGRGLSEKLIRYLHRISIGTLMPDLTFVIDAPAEELLDVLDRKDRDRMEIESIEFQKRVRKGYLAIAARQPSRVKVVRRKALQMTHADVMKKWESFLNGRKNNRKVSHKNQREK